MTSIIFATPAAAYQTSVSVNAPESADRDFSAVIKIENAVDLDTCSEGIPAIRNDCEVTV